MIFLNPQWQGAGDWQALEKGALILSAFLNKAGMVTVPLSDQPLDQVNDIFAYRPICEQLDNFRGAVDKLAPEKMWTIGGDCGIEVIPVSYLNKRYGNDLVVAWFDGHTDLNSPASSPSKHFHGMPVRTLLGEGEEGILRRLFPPLTPEQFVYIGVNDMDPAEEDYVQKHHIDLIPVPDQARISGVIAGKKKRNLYIHFDLDVLAEKEFPHTPFPNKTGFTVADAVRIIRGLKNEYNLVGSAVTESIADDPEKLGPIEILLRELIN